MKDDATTNIKELKDLIVKFRDDRNWKRFHDPKNLAEAISIESTELLELFLWKTTDDIEKKLQDIDYKEEVSSELADVLIFCLNFADRTGIDVSVAIKQKLEKNNKKYPIDKTNNQEDFKKYNKL